MLTLLTNLQAAGTVIAKRGETTKDNPYARPHGIKGFRCFQIGHKSNECPSSRQLRIMDGEFGIELMDDLEAD